MMQKKTRITQFEHIEDAFSSDGLPLPGQKVEVIGSVGGAEHLIPFRCCWTEEGWVIADTRRLLEFNVLRWRPIHH